MTKFTYNGQEILFDRVYKFALKNDNQIVFCAYPDLDDPKHLKHSFGYIKYVAGNLDWERHSDESRMLFDFWHGQGPIDHINEYSLFDSDDISEVKKVLDLTGGKLPFDLVKERYEMWKKLGQGIFDDD